MRCALRLVVDEGEEFHVTTHTGTNGNDLIDGGNGTDSIYGLGGDDIIFGGNGGDTLDGGDGNDQLFGENGNEHLFGGSGDDLIDGNNGFDIVYYSGLIEEYKFLASTGYLYIHHIGGTASDGHDQVARVERLVFADRVIDIGSGHNRPIAYDNHVSLTEDSGSASGNVLADDFDFDGDAMSATAGTFVGAYGTLILNSNGSYSYTLSAAAQALAAGQNVVDSFNYIVTDNDGSDTGKVVIHIGGLNDAPVAHSDAASTGENQILLFNVLANDSDIDNGAVLTLTNAVAPAGQGTASVVDNKVQFDPGGNFESLALGESANVVVSYNIVDEHGATGSSTLTVTVTGANDGPVANPDSAATGENGTILIDVGANDTDVDHGAILTVTGTSVPAGKGSAAGVGRQIQFNPGTDFDDLAVGETEVVVIGYTIADEHGASASSTLTITVTGTNDAPVARPDARTTSETSAVVVDVLANDSDADHDAVLVVTSASWPTGKGNVTIVENQVRFDPGTDFAHLGSGESEQVVIQYTIEDQFGVQASSTVTITVQGRDEGSTTTGTEGDDTLTGTPGDDTISALGGDDTVFGLAGGDLLDGGNGNDNLIGDDGDDVLLGGDGFDQLSGDADNDVLEGGNQGDSLSGGDGDDQLSGDAGDDALSGDDGNDQLLGGDGKDSLGGGAGNDTLDGGAGDDSLAGGEGTDSLVGGDGQDFLFGGLGTSVMSGGSGNDTIRLNGRSFASTITTGSGSDTIEVAHADVGTAVMTVTDFAAGAGGDRFRLSGDDGALLSLLSGWDGSSNPFGPSGFLRLQQSGADTLLQWDQDGGGDNWETLVVFENTDDAAFTDANFVPGYHPNGSAPAGQTITGTADGDTLTGTIGGDTINALAGDDSVSGGAGADQINGGDGVDFLNGETGNDVVDGGNQDDFLFGGKGDDQLSGQAGNDSIIGEEGDDQLSGGAGDDSIDGGANDDSLTGGDGDDFLTDLAGTNSLVGGIGADQIFASSADGAQTIDGGDGGDTIRHYNRNFASEITTGSGIDTIELANVDQGTAAIVVTDFTAGAGGDKLRLSDVEGSVISLLSGWDGSNPFGSGGFLRLEQSGANTLLQWDQDGGGDDWETLVVFENTDADDFTDANFLPGYNPDGSMPAGQTIDGTEGDDSLTGTIGDDTINALGGVDFVNAGAGADTINGGDGTDFLSGEADNDVVNGGNDDDSVFGGDGDDQLSGESGDDSLFGESGEDSLLGGAGNDNIDGGADDDSLTGGDGDDYLSDFEGANSLDGGIGDDKITAGSTDGAQTIGGGDGNDTIRHYYRHFASEITTGAGSDTIELLNADQGTAAIVVTDFTPGADGDRLQLAGDDGSLLSLLSGWDGSSNPFGSGGFLRLEQSGADTLLQWDQDGGGSSWQTLAIFENTDADDFTADNFVPGYDPDGATPAGETITGTAADDSLTGTIGADTINGLAGNDVVAGGSGGDQINGGDGSDFLNGEADNDVVDGGNGDDTLLGGGGDDTLIGQGGSDGLYGEDGDDVMSGGDDDDSLEGGGGEDTLTGGGGADFLTGGRDSDTLTGGAGGDFFNFEFAAHGEDSITDFVSGTDFIRVSAEGFGGGLVSGDSVSLVSGSDPVVEGSGGQFLYDTDDGRLFWDADGTGGGDAVLVATFANAPSLDATDFIVV
jgi:VCBS repeat-containing protein